MGHVTSDRYAGEFVAFLERPFTDIGHAVRDPYVKITPKKLLAVSVISFALTAMSAVFLGGINIRVSVAPFVVLIFCNLPDLQSHGLLTPCIKHFRNDLVGSAYRLV